MNFDLVYRQISFVIYGNQYLNDSLKNELSKMPHFRMRHPIVRNLNTTHLLAGSIDLLLYHLKQNGAYKLSLIHAPKLASFIEESKNFYLNDSFYDYCILIQHRDGSAQFLIGCEEKQLWYFTHQINKTNLRFINIDSLKDRTQAYTLLPIHSNFTQNLEELKPIDWESFSQSYLDKVYINRIAAEACSPKLIKNISNVNFENRYQSYSDFSIFPDSIKPNFAAELLMKAEWLYNTYSAYSESRNDQAFCNTATREEIKLFKQAEEALNNFYPYLIINSANHYQNSEI